MQGKVPDLNPTPKRIGATATAALLMTAGCGESTPVDLRFEDPVVEARARGFETWTFENTSCEALWAVPAREVGRLPGALDRRTGAYPPKPSEILPEDSEGWTTLHVAIRDPDGLVLARGCAEGGGTEVELWALPPCVEPPPALDLATVFDRSSPMLAADVSLEGVASTFRTVFAEGADFPPGSSFLLVSFGEGSVNTAVEASASILDIGLSVEAIAALGFSGEPVLSGAIVRAARLLRDRASCLRRPALVVIAAGGDHAGSQAITADAAFALYASQSTPADDIFAFGIGLDDFAVDTLALAIPEGVGEVRGALTVTTYSAALAEASQSVRLKVQ